MLNPEFWLDEELSKISPRARLLYMGLWGICDDNYATFPDRPEWIKVQVFPYEEDVNIKELLKEIEKIGKILPFESEGKKYYCLKNFFKHQRVDKPSRPKYPQYPLPLPDYSATTPDEEKRSKVKRREVKLSKENSERFEQFWVLYPNKKVKKKAKQSWAMLEMTDKLFKEIMTSLAQAIKTPQWTKDNGQYIPYPTTWLNNERWNDEVNVGIIKKSDKF